MEINSTLCDPDSVEGVHLKASFCLCTYLSINKSSKGNMSLCEWLDGKLGSQIQATELLFAFDVGVTLVQGTCDFIYNH